jgi:Kef-type K+ transport system membrane component KefB
VISTLLASPLVLVGLILFLGASLGDAAERAKVPWITGSIIAGVILGPAVTGLLQGPKLEALDGFAQASLAVIAFNIGSQLALTRLKEIGRSIALLALAQLLTPFVLVSIAEIIAGLSIPTALIVSAVATATAPTTTFSVIERLNASGPFVDRVFGILAINDSATILIFSVASATAIALLGAHNYASIISASLLNTAIKLALSVAVGIVLGVVYLAVHRFIEDGTPGWESRLTAILLGLLVISIGGAITLGLSHLLVPLSLGIVIANVVEGAERLRIHHLIRAFEEPLFIIFFVLAGAHLPLSATEHLTILAFAVIYVAGRFAGKYLGIFLTASALRLDRPTRSYLGLCFPSQGGLAMGLILAFRSSAEIQHLPTAVNQPIEAAVSIVLVSVLLSQIFGPVLIDFAVRRGSS